MTRVVAIGDYVLDVYSGFFGVLEPSQHRGHVCVRWIRTIYTEADATGKHVSHYPDNDDALHRAALTFAGPVVVHPGEME